MKSAFQNKPDGAIDANARGDSLNEADSLPGNLGGELQAVRKRDSNLADPTAPSRIR